MTIAEETTLIPQGQKSETREARRMAGIKVLRAAGLIADDSDTISSNSLGLAGVQELGAADSSAEGGKAATGVCSPHGSIWCVRADFSTREQCISCAMCT